MELKKTEDPEEQITKLITTAWNLNKSKQVEMKKEQTIILLIPKRVPLLHP